MPSKTPKQARFMQAAAHNPKLAKQAGIKQSVAREFAAADKAKNNSKPVTRKR
jgi:hypothetical protein